MGVFSANGNMTSGDGHIMLDFEKIFAAGQAELFAKHSRQETSWRIPTLLLFPREFSMKRLFWLTAVS